MRTALVARLGVMVAAGLLLTACSALGGGAADGTDDYGTDSGASSGNAGGANDAGKAGDGYGDSYGTEGGAAAAKGALKVADSDFGKILTDAEGRALYAFTQDTDGRSNCNAGCAESWPPLLAEGKPAGSGGVDQSLLKTVSREDGTKQVVIRKWPLYYFAGDSAPGDTTGQGMDGVWWLVGANGALVKSR